MPQENKRLKFTLEEVLGHKPVPDEELEISRTNDFGDAWDSNYESAYKRWSLGLRNSADTKLANIVTKHLKESFNLSDFLEFLRWNQLQLFQFMSTIIDKILSKSTGVKF
jgi:hypothetical protein